MAALVDTTMPEITRQLSEPLPDIEPDVVVKSKPRPVALLQDEEPAVLEVSHSDNHIQIQQQTTTPSSPPGVPSVTQASSEVTQKKANGDVLGVEKVAPSQATAENIEQVAVKREEEFEDSTAMLLRRYTASKNGQHAHIPITPTGEIGGTLALKETFRVGGRNCTVRLEEDYVSWVPNGKRDGKLIPIVCAIQILSCMCVYMYMYVVS